MSVGLYSLGTLFLIASVAFVFHLAHLPQSWIAGSAFFLLVSGVLGALTGMRGRPGAALAGRAIPPRAGSKLSG